MKNSQFKQMCWREYSFLLLINVESTIIQRGTTKKIDNGSNLRNYSEEESKQSISVNPLVPRIQNNKQTDKRMSLEISHH